MKEVLVYIEYGATEELSYDGAFSGIDVEFIKEKSTFSDSDKKGKWAFKGSIKGVVSSAFNGKKSLLSIILPEGITFIGNSAFLNSGLEAITLPESLMEIGQSVFLGTWKNSLLGMYIFDRSNDRQNRDIHRRKMF